MHYLLELSSSANPDLNFWLSKVSKNSVLGVQMTHRWLRPCLTLEGPIYHIRTYLSPHFATESFL